MLVIRRLFGAGTNCIAPSGLPLLLCLFPGLAPWAFLSRPCGASFAPETNYTELFTLGGTNGQICITVGAGFPPLGTEDLTWGMAGAGHATKIRLACEMTAPYQDDSRYAVDFKSAIRNPQ